MDGRVLTCVYCGHEYPQETPAWGNEVLTEHIRVCPKHPMRRAEADIALFHVTTGRKVKAYRMTGRINAPVRGFDTLQGAMAWAMKVGRKVIMRVECVTPAQMLPDHHNEWGKAWWTGDVPVDRMKCAYSAEGAWPCPDTANTTHQARAGSPSPECAGSPLDSGR